jgi:hypothetical protein
LGEVIKAFVRSCLSTCRNDGAKLTAMADSIPADLAEDQARTDRGAYWEQRLFVYSPFGTFVTSVLVFAVLATSFAGAMAISGAAIFRDGTLLPAPQVRLALWFALQIATILGMQRYSRNRERADFAAWSRILKGGDSDAMNATELTPRGIRLGPATVIGALIGAASSWFAFRGEAFEPAVFLWFAAATILLGMLFARGVALTRSSGVATRAMIDNQLKIDLLRIDELAVIGHSSARTALIWFTISAVVLLQFISGDLSPVTIALLVACAAMGLWIFVRTMEHVHRRIHAAKSAELARLRGEIDRVCHAATADASAAQCLQGLLAYEARIMAAPEWPFDQTTAMRVAASAFIVTVPWFGQAIAGYFVEHWTHG